MEKIEPKDIINSAAILANGIMNNINGGIDLGYDESRIKMIWNLSLETVLDSLPIVNTICEDGICDEDLVVLRIDSYDVERFVLITLPGRLKEAILPADTMIGHEAYKDNQCRFINTCTSLGSELLGRKVGDVFKWYTDDADKRLVEHRIEVMSFQRTPRSKITNRCEVAADITLYKQQEDNNQKRKQ